MAADRLRYRFIGRGSSPAGVPYYIWQARIRNDSRVHEVRCTVDWFWGPMDGENVSDINGDLIFVDTAEPVFGAQVGPTLVKVHGRDRCKGQHCCIHNPSDHHMVTWRQNWRGDRGLMERMCPHDIGHPDPDDLYYKRLTRGEEYAYYEGIHGCDGCCRTPEEAHD